MIWFNLANWSDPAPCDKRSHYEQKISFSHLQESLGMRLHFLIHLSVSLCRVVSNCWSGRWTGSVDGSYRYRKYPHSWHIFFNVVIAFHSHLLCYSTSHCYVKYEPLKMQMKADTINCVAIAQVHRCMTRQCSMHAHLEGFTNCVYMRYTHLPIWWATYIHHS